MKPWAALCEHVTAGEPWKPTKDPGTLIFLPVITCKKANKFEADETNSVNQELMAAKTTSIHQPYRMKNSC